MKPVDDMGRHLWNRLDGFALAEVGGAFRLDWRIDIVGTGTCLRAALVRRLRGKEALFG